MDDLDMQSESLGWAVAGMRLYRWDGAAWSPVEMAGPVAALDVLGTAAGWAVGKAAYRWDGTAWSLAVSSGPAEVPMALAVRSATEAWGVGQGGITWQWDGVTWREKLAPSPRRLQAVVEDETGEEAWAVGEGGDIWHWHHPAWRQMASPVTDRLTGVDMVSAADAWAVGENGSLLHWDGADWAAMPSPTAGDLHDLSFVASDHGWAVASSHEPPWRSFILRWDGSQWQEVFATEAVELMSIHMRTPTDGYAAGSALQPGPGILHWDGNSWLPFADPRIDPGGEAPIVVAAGASDVWLGTNGEGIYHWDGHGWQTYGEPRDVTALAVGPESAWGWAAAADEGLSRIWRWDGTAWVADTAPQLFALQISDFSRRWAVGGEGPGGVILSRAPEGWTERLVPLRGSHLTSVSMVSSTDGWAVGPDPGAAADPDRMPGVMLRWDGRQWYQAARPEPGAEAVDML